MLADGDAAADALLAPGALPAVLTVAAVATLLAAVALPPVLALRVASAAVLALVALPPLCSQMPLAAAAAQGIPNLDGMDKKCVRHQNSYK